MTATESRQNATKRMYLFGVPRLGGSILLGIQGFALLHLYTNGYGLDAPSVEMANVVGLLAIAFSQFFFGWISDKWVTRWGRRKPYVIILAPVEVLSFICLILPGLFLQSPSNETLFGWLLMWNLLFEVGYAVTTPYGAWMAELFSVEERPKTSQINNYFGMVGTGFMSVFSLIALTGITDQMNGTVGFIPPLLLDTTLLFAVIFLASFFLAIVFLPTEALPKVKPDLLKNMKNIFHNKNYMAVVLMQGFASLSWYMVGNLMLNYVSNVLHFTTIEYILAGVTLLAGIFLFLYMWRLIIARKGKKWGLLLIFVVAAAILCCSLLGMVPSSDMVVFGLLFIAGIAASLGGWYLISGIWYADLAEDDEKRTEEMKAGLYGGFPSIVLNLFQALSAYILSLMLGWPDISNGTGDPFSAGYVWWGPIAAIFLVATFIYSWRFIKLDYEWEKKQKVEKT
jgi:glycoside/pentoside/hexuronide:cation symporter, GPH family